MTTKTGLAGLTISQAAPGDLDRLLTYRREASAWLAERGIDQWANAFPADHILASIEAGHVYLVHDQAAGDVAATVTLDTEPEPDLWTDAELAEPSRHVHKLIVRRPWAGSGLGVRILNWCDERAADEGSAWLRINVNTTNPGLQNYYLAQGFEYVRTVDGPVGVGGAGVAGWLAQRRVRSATVTPDPMRATASG